MSWRRQGGPGRKAQATLLVAALLIVGAAAFVLSQVPSQSPTGAVVTQTQFRQPLKAQAAPSVTSINLATTNTARNDSDQNLTLSLAVSADAGKNVTNITSWFRNGTGVMLLNLPMEKTGSESTTVKDYGGFGRDGTVNSAVFNATGGRDGRGAYTMRAGSNINFGNVLGFERTDRWSFTAWVKRSDTSGLDFFVAKQYQTAPYTGYSIFGSSSTLCIQWVNTNPTNELNLCGLNNLTGNGWHHIAVTTDGSSTAAGIALYVDGFLSTNNVSRNTLTASMQTAAPLLIGDRASGGFGLNGNIDDVAIWNRTLSAHEVALLAADRKDVLANDELVVGDYWSACVTPNDGTQDGAQACSNNVTVRAVVPLSLAFVSPTPDDGNVTPASSVAIAVNVSNGSGLREYSFNWNGSSFTSYNQSLIGAWSFEDLPMDDPFNGPDGSLPDSNRYSVLTFVNGSSIQGNRLMCNQSSTQPDWFSICNVGMPNRPFNGDFDVSIFTDDSNLTGASGTYLVLDLSNASGTVWDVGAIANDDTVFTYPAWTQYAGYGVSSYLRMRRMGTTLYAYAKTFTGSWNLLATKTNVDGPLTLYFRSYTTTGSHTGGRGYFDDLRVYEGQLLNDSSTLGMNPMTSYNASLVPGKYGQGVFFSGLNSSVKLNDNRAYSGMDKLSVEAWVNFRGLGPLNYIGMVTKWDNNVGTENPFFLGTDNAASRNIGFLVQTTGGEANSYSSLGMPRGNWTHLLGVYNGSKAILYVNGDKIYEYAVTGKVRNSSDFLCIGCYDSSSNSQIYFNGTIDEVRIWNRSFNEAEARELYASNLRPNGTGAWQFSTNRTSLTAGGNYSYSASATTPDGTGTTETRTLLRQSQAPPVVNSINLNTTNPALNDTNQNLTLQLATSSSIANPVSNITNWYRNGENIVLLNYPFEGTGTETAVAKDYAQGLNATVFGATWRAASGRNSSGAYEFSGTSQYLQSSINAGHRVGANLTLEAWIYPHTQGTYEGIVSTISDDSSVESGYALLMDGTSGVYFGLVPNGQAATYLSSGASSITLNKWSHVVGTYNGTTMTVYVNGVRKASTSIAATAIDYTPANNLTIGAFLDSNEFYPYDGLIDEVRVYNRTLSLDEITLLYNNRTDILANDELTAGDVWAACVTPNDGTQDGAMACSNNVTVRAAGWDLPVVNSISLNTTNPALNDTNQNLTLQLSTSASIAGRSVANITTWYRNGTGVMVLNMPFEATGRESRNATDYSGIGNNGTVIGATWGSSAGHDGKGAYVFDGSGDAIFLSYPVASSTNLYTGSVFAWIKTSNAGSSFRGVVVKAGGYGMFLVDNALAIYDWNAGAVRNSGVTVNDNKWHLVGFTFRSGVGSGTQLYVDGVSVLTTTLTIANTGTAVAIGMGDNPTINGQDFAGTIDDVSVWNRSLSAHEVALLYQNRTTELANDELVAGDRWSACVTPNDGTQDGARVCSNTVTLTAPSTLPVVTSINLSTNDPIKNDTNQNLTLSFAVSSPLSYPVKNFTNWYRNSTSILLLYLPFEAGSTSSWTPDYSSLGRHGTVSGATYGGTSGYDGGGAYTFDGSSNYINMGTWFNYQNFTIMMWLKPGTTQVQYADIIDNNHDGDSNWVVQQDSSTTNRYWWGIYFTLTASVWQHLTIKADRGTCTVYINGVSQGSAGCYNPFNYDGNPANNLNFGRHHTLGRYWKGSMDDIRIYNRPLSAHEIALIATNRSSNVMANDELVTGDTWKACVTPNDGTQDGATSCSNNITIIINTVVLSGVSAGNATNAGATIAWASDAASNSTVRYGTTTALGSNAGADNSVTQHSVALSGLANSTLYYYNVTSCSGSTCGTSGPYNFTTIGSYYANCPNTTGVWTLPSSTSKSGNIVCESVTVPLGITLTAGGALRIDADSVTVAGAIAGTGTGCPESQSPNVVTNVCYDGGGGAGYGEGADGGWNEGGGGGYGGNGGTGTIAGGMRYGDPLNPLLLGSGGGHGYGGNGGAGGGAVRIVANSVAVSGSIGVDGTNGGYDAGGGSGGSVWIETASLSGAGSITARGGNAGTGSGGNHAIAGAGAGGRIAIYTNSSSFSGSILVTPGTTYTAGQVGTAILVDVDDNAAWITGGFEFNKSIYYAAGSFKPTAVSDYNFNSLTIKSGSALVGISANVSADTLNMSGASITCYAALSPLLLSINSSTLPAHSARLVTDHYYGSTLSFSGCGPLTIDDPADQMGGTTTTSDNDILVTTQGNMTSIITTASTAIINASALTIGGTVSARTAIIDVENLTITGTINGKGNGCPATQSPNLATGVCYDRGTSANLGEGSDENFGAGGGGAYGGAAGYGTSGGGWPYGNPLQPTYPGSGGGNGYNYAGGAGGGAVRIISGRLNVSGDINVDGNNAAGDNGGGGSGGSVWIETDFITGSGSITSRGGTPTGTMGGQNTPPGSGSGGRIAIYVNSSSYTGRINVSGGARYAVAEAGTAIFVLLPQNVARVYDGFDFNKTVYYPAGSFKPTATSDYSFASLQTTSSRVLIGLTSNVSADSFNISGTALTCRNNVGTLLLAVNSTSLPEHAVRVATNHYYGGSLSTTSCNRLVIDDQTDQLATTTISSDNDITLLTQGSISAITSAASTIIVNASSLTANGNIVGRTTIIDADSLVLNGNINSQGTGCPATQSPNLATGVCYDRGTSANIGEGSDANFGAGGGGAYGGAAGYGTNGGGSPYGNPIQPSLPGSGGGNGYSYPGGAGGGAVRIISSAVTLNGYVSANGNNAGGDNGGGASGGSIWLETDSLGGSGAITARGGSVTGTMGGQNTPPGSGSGGRIAIYYNTSTYTGSINVTGGMTYATGERGTAIAVDVNDNTAYIYDGFEFNSTVSYPGASFKRTSQDGYDFNRVDAPSALLRYVGTMKLNATELNLVNAASRIQVGTRIMLQYSSQSSDIGKSYATLFGAVGNYFLSVDDRQHGRVDWLGGINNITNLNSDLNISSNKVSVNAVSSRSLNTSANVSINTPMSSYSILFDQFDGGTGVLCSFCTNYGAANGQGRFATTHFSSYWLSAPHAFVAPVNATVNSSFVFNGTTNMTLRNGSLYDVDQVIQVVERSTGRPKLEISGAFSQYDVNLSSLIVVVTPTKTVIVANGLTGVGMTHSLFVPITTAQGVYVCPNATTIESIVPGCEGYTHWSYAQAVAGTSKQLDALGYNVTVTIVGSDYKIAGLHGTGSAEGGVTSLRIWDETEQDGSPYAGYVRRQGEQVVFFANFTNASGLPANTSNGGCVVDFADMTYNGYEAMRYNPVTKLFEFNRSFGLGADREWKVNCTGSSGGTRDNVEATDTVAVLGEPQAVPEFGTWALLAALGLVAGGVVSMRNRGTSRSRKQRRS